SFCELFTTFPPSLGAGDLGVETCFRNQVGSPFSFKSDPLRNRELYPTKILLSENNKTKDANIIDDGAHRR
ncbi:MAG: hypothetical protein ACOC8Y_06000, partial [Candidatus Natronoplasma sp.]